MSARLEEERLRAGLCADCRHVRRIVSAKGSVFFRCNRADHDPSLRDYPPLPVIRCHGFARVEPDVEQEPRR